jgi:beta-phosphoglucomutase
MAHPFIAEGLALLFDMDGVLIQSNHLHLLAWEEYLHLHGVGVDVSEIYHHMHGRRNDEIVRDFFPDARSAEEIDRHGAGKEALYRKMMLPVFREHLTPGVEEFLGMLDGVRTAVVSNAEPANVDFVLDVGDLRRYFSIIVDGHQVKNPKPSPEIYLEAFRRLQVDPQKCIVFEDSLTGIQAACAAGARVVAVNPAEIDGPEVDLKVQDFRSPSLISWLKGLQ